MKKEIARLLLLSILTVLTAQILCAAQALGNWKLVDTAVNPNEIPLEYYGGESGTPGWYNDPRYEGKYQIFTVSETSFSVHDVHMDHGYLYYDVTLTTSFDAPPSELVPGETISLNGTCSHSGQVNEGSPALLFQYRGEGVSISPSSAFWYAPWNDAFTGEASSTYSFTVPKTGSGQIKISAFWWNCGMAYVLWTYEAEAEESTTTTSAEPNSTTSSVSSTTTTSTPGGTTTTIPDVVPTLKLTYPAGYSPKVFIEGWVFGAECTYVDGYGNTVDISDRVVWSGTNRDGSEMEFSPAQGSRSRPKFTCAGSNTFRLSVTLNNREYSEEYTVEAINPEKYSRLGDKALCPADAHGCPGCSHPVQGPIITGSPNVMIDDLPAARKGDNGIHAACCDGNIYTIVAGDKNVLIDGLPAAKTGIMTRHCGGYGAITEGSPTRDTDCDKSRLNVCGLHRKTGSLRSAGSTISGSVVDSAGRGIYGVGVTAYIDDAGTTWGAITDQNGAYTITGVPEGEVRIYFWGGNSAYNDGFTGCWYSGKADRDSADTVTVPSSGIVTGVNATLSAGAGITGTIKDASGNGIPTVSVKGFDESDNLMLAVSDENGDYRIAGLKPGKYRVFCDAAMLGYKSIWYNAVDSRSSASAITVSSTGMVSGIDFTLKTGGSITGTVTGAGRQGLENIFVIAYGSSTGSTGMGQTDAEGLYTIGGLTADTYRVLFQGGSAGYGSVWYGGAANWDNASLVTVSDSGQTSGIDGQLSSGCPLSKTISNKAHLNALRKFRDEHLRETTGNSIRSAYYKSSQEISQIIERNPAFKERLADLVRKNIQTVIKLNRTGAAVINKENIDEAALFLSALASEGSPELQKNIGAIISGLEDGTLLASLGVSIK